MIRAKTKDDAGCPYTIDQMCLMLPKPPRYLVWTGRTSMARALGISRETIRVWAKTELAPSWAWNRMMVAAGVLRTGKDGRDLLLSGGRWIEYKPTGEKEHDIR